jgi:hypothetical protein
MKKTLKAASPLRQFLPVPSMKGGEQVEIFHALQVTPDQTVANKPYLCIVSACRHSIVLRNLYKRKRIVGASVLVERWSPSEALKTTRKARK